MLRQLANLRRYGRLRTNDPTPRKRKPQFLREHPELEFSKVLEFIVAHYDKPDRDFFFVEIGAFDGVTADPIYDLVRQRGWHGVLVEPQLEAFELLKKNYRDQQGLQFFNVVIGDHDGEATLYTRDGGMVQAASIEKQLMNKPGRRRHIVDARQVPCWTFDTLLKEAAAPQTIDLLQIDAEGFDYEIIRSIDFDRVKPAIIHYEHMVLSQPERNACLELLASHGYRFCLEDSDTTAYHVDAYHGSSLEHEVAA
jgi:FkbM family methyltransferase